MPRNLALSTYLGPNLDPAAAALARSLSKKVRVEISFDASLTADQRLERITSGDVDLMWMCGLLTLEMIDQNRIGADIVATPVFAGETAPVYRSVVVVGEQSPYREMTDLAGTRLVVNQWESWSGHHALRAHLEDLGHPWPFFGSAVESGSHAASVTAVAAGDAECAAVDHTMWRYLVEGRVDGLRGIGVTRDWPSPPLALSSAITGPRRDSLVDVLLGMTGLPGVDRLVAARNETYRPLADYARPLSEAQGVIPIARLSNSQ